jgi:hypothetical protein
MTSGTPIAAILAEVRRVAEAVQEELDPETAGPLVVSGMLAEQLARELAAGADPGAVVAGDASRLQGASALVHVMAGEPSAADDTLVRQADALGVPVVLVQLWPQEEWTPPFVLSPFVVECRPGLGFPVTEIARRLVEAVENAPALARRIPVLQDPVGDAVVGTAAIRAAIVGAVGARAREARPLLTLEQIRMLAELRTLNEAPRGQEALRSLAGLAAGVVGAGFLFREAARNAERALPSPLVRPVVAAAGTWVLGEALRKLEARLSSN